MSRRLSKKLSMKVARLNEAHPTSKVELWCEDEHRLGSKPIIRKVWSPIGERPSREVHWLILPTVNARVFSSCWFWIEPDGTQPRRLKFPKGETWSFLPSSSPELQPSERRLWPLSNEGVANRHFEEIEELEEALIERRVALCNQPEVIRSHTRYHWWPQAA